MIQKLRNGKGSVARFGTGTVRINAYTLKTRYGGQIELTQVKAQPVGSETDSSNVVSGSNKIVLDFASLQSLDILLEKLQDLRNDLEKES